MTDAPAPGRAHRASRLHRILPVVAAARQELCDAVAETCAGDGWLAEHLEG